MHSLADPLIELLSRILHFAVQLPKMLAQPSFHETFDDDDNDDEERSPAHPIREILVQNCNHRLALICRNWLVNLPRALLEHPVMHTITFKMRDEGERNLRLDGGEERLLAMDVDLDVPDWAKNSMTYLNIMFEVEDRCPPFDVKAGRLCRVAALLVGIFFHWPKIKHLNVRFVVKGWDGWQGINVPGTARYFGEMLVKETLGEGGVLWVVWSASNGEKRRVG
ncbi:hypothetical protein LTR95_000609 [Oleoguttula sp. CCFEE 5521]